MPYSNNVFISAYDKRKVLKYMKRIIYRVCRSDITDFKTIFVKTYLI